MTDYWLIDGASPTALVRFAASLALAVAAFVAVVALLTTFENIAVNPQPATEVTP